MRGRLAKRSCSGKLASEVVGQTKSARTICGYLLGLGLRVPYERSGPLWALKDGNHFLRPLKCSATNYSLVCGHVSRGSTAQRSPRQCMKQLRRSLISDPVTANTSWLPGKYVVFHQQLLHFWGVEVFSDGEAMCYKSCRRHEGYSVTQEDLKVMRVDARYKVTFLPLNEAESRDGALHSSFCRKACCLETRCA